MKLELKSLHQILEDEHLSRANGNGSDVMGNVLVDTTVVYPHRTGSAIKGGIPFGMNPWLVCFDVQKGKALNGFLGYTRVWTVDEVVEEATYVRRKFSKRVKAFKKRRQFATKARTNDTELLGQLSSLDRVIRNTVRGASSSVYEPEHQALYNAVEKVVYEISDLEGFTRFTDNRDEPVRTDEKIAALAIYLSLFEGKPSSIVTGKLRQFPKFLAKSLLFFRQMFDHTNDKLRHDIYEHVRMSFRKRLDEVGVRMYTPLRSTNHNCGKMGAYKQCPIPCVEMTQLTIPESVEKVGNLVHMAFVHYTKGQPALR